ncbi:hypothetical protein JTE90_001682 [Oedothorax gibbosus]|uniref:Uncharacterized protein n=1 Tax=Oedothorax gibbosus TaxID=931172 RepID=A0AAV6UHZ3_9ARAC|nr:hypothetical protein JTE90_001682 [Oedothorax gibbosus]
MSIYISASQASKTLCASRKLEIVSLKFYSMACTNMSFDGDSLVDKLFNQSVLVKFHGLIYPNRARAARQSPLARRHSPIDDRWKPITDRSQWTGKKSDASLMDFHGKSVTFQAPFNIPCPYIGNFHNGLVGK